MTETKNKVLKLLGDNVNKEQVETVIELVESKLLLRLAQLVPGTIVIPDSLKFIVVELAIVRFNRIGSEGMSVETVEGHSATYENLLSSYEDDILAWAEEQGYSKERRGKVRAF